VISPLRLTRLLLPLAVGTGARVQRLDRLRPRLWIAIVCVAAIVGGGLALSGVSVDAPDSFDPIFEPAPTSIDCGSAIQPSNPNGNVAVGDFPNLDSSQRNQLAEALDDADDACGDARQTRLVFVLVVLVASVALVLGTRYLLTDKSRDVTVGQEIRQQ
jgi:hypothetical protein